MINPTSPGPTSTAPRGISAEVMRLLGSLTQHFQSLATLAGLEGREAVGFYVRAAIALGATLFFAAFGYVFLVLTVAFALDYFFEVPWIWIALGFGVLHLLGAAIAAAIMKKNFTRPVFRATTEEIRRDIAALRASETGNSAPLM